MKHLTFAFVTLSSLTLVFTACSKKDEAATPEPAATETAPEADPAPTTPVEEDEAKVDPAALPAPADETAPPPAEAVPAAAIPKADEGAAEEEPKDKTEGGEEEEPME